MQTISEYTKLSVPTYALSYLVNGDDSGLEETDKNTIDEWVKQFDDEAKAIGASVIFFTENDYEGYFTWAPEFGLACTCVDATVLICK